MERIDHSKPHPDAVLCRISTGEVMPYPTDPRQRNVDQDLSDAMTAGYVVVVPIVRTSDGVVRHHSIESQVGGRDLVDRLLRQRRTHNGKDVQARMLASEWARLSPEERNGYLTSAPVIDPRDALIAAQNEKIAAMEEAAKSDKKSGK